MDIVTIQHYLFVKKERQHLESQLKGIGKKLSEASVDEEKTFAGINPDSLISAKSAKIINELLSNRPLWLNGFPVDFVQFTFAGGGAHLSVVFSQPLFWGWHTEIPYKSWQMCSLSLETPIPPDENHVPEYMQVSDHDLDVICWERVGDSVKLWSDDKRGIIFRWGIDNSAITVV